jgi:NDP-sugar pyrophosphorylase family protein
LTSYLAEKFPAYFGDGSRFGLSIEYSVSELEAESGTRVLKARALLEDTFLLLYGDNFWPIPVARLALQHEQLEKLVTMVAFTNKDGSSEYGFENNLTVKSGLITHYGERGTGENAIDVGTFVVEKKALDYMPIGNPVFQRDLINALIPKQQVAAYLSDTDYCFVTSLELIPRVEKYIQKYTS